MAGSTEEIDYGSIPDDMNEEQMREYLALESKITWPNQRKRDSFEKQWNNNRQQIKDKYTKQSVPSSKISGNIKQQIPKDMDEQQIKDYLVKESEITMPQKGKHRRDHSFKKQPIPTTMTALSRIHQKQTNYAEEKKPEATAIHLTKKTQQNENDTSKTFASRDELGENTILQDMLSKRVDAYSSFEVMSSLLFGFAVSILFGGVFDESIWGEDEFDFLQIIFVILMCYVLISSALSTIIISISHYFIMRYMADGKYAVALIYFETYSVLRYGAKISFYSGIIIFIVALGCYLYPQLNTGSSIAMIIMLTLGTVLLAIILYIMLKPSKFMNVDALIAHYKQQQVKSASFTQTAFSENSMQSRNAEGKLVIKQIPYSAKTHSCVHVYMETKPELPDHIEHIIVYFSKHFSVREFLEFLKNEINNAAVKEAELEIFVADQDGDLDDDFPKPEDNAIIARLGLEHFYIKLKNATM